MDWHEALHAALHALEETAILLPFLIVIYIVIELLERKTNLSESNSRLSGGFGPLLGAATGLIPQCGFSVMAAKLFEKKYITLGTLLAIFFATSDEAFATLVSQPSGAEYLAVFILIKLVVGIAVGYATDGVLRLFNVKQVSGVPMPKKTDKKTTKDLFFERIDEDENVGCTSCGRDHERETPVKTYFLYPLWHAVKVALMIFAVKFLLGVVMEAVGKDNFYAFMQRGLFLQPLICALIGLIPNCASSVFITQCFLDGGIGLGSCIAGLCANAGLGFVVLIKNTKKWKRNLALIAVTYAISVAVGCAINAATLLF